MIPGIEQIVKQACLSGIEDIIIGTAHRGRLTLLSSVLEMPYKKILSKFQGSLNDPNEVLGSGDVKYHLGVSADREFEKKKIHLSLTSNPSHLEAVNPVVAGKVRAKQTLAKDKTTDKVIGLLIHGDAAIAGQGVVAETFAMSQLRGFKTGGTIHFVINNQIGFTTMPQYGRSAPYCTEIAKMVQAPIFHVNGDDPEAVVHVCRLATEFRNKFKVDDVKFPELKLIVFSLNTLVSYHRLKAKDGVLSNVKPFLVTPSDSIDFWKWFYHTFDLNREPLQFILDVDGSFQEI